MRDKGLYHGSLLFFSHVRKMAIYAIKISIQDNFLYTVSNKKWKSAIDSQFQVFTEEENYPFHKIKDIGDIAKVREILFKEAKSFINEYERLGYSFTAMFKSILRKNDKVLQLAVGSCPELVYLVKDLQFDYYVEDPLFPEIFKSIDLREVFKDEIKEFCDLPAETMGGKYPNYFDIIVCHNVLNHTYNPGKVLDSIYQMLKGGGYVFDLTMRQASGSSHPGIIGRRALIKGYMKRKFEVIYSGTYKHLDYPSIPQKRRYYTVLRLKKQVI